MKYYVPYTDKKMSLTSDSIKKRSFAIKNHFSRNKLNIYEALISLGIKTYRCGFCGEMNSRFYVVTEIDGDTIRIIGADYTYLDADSAKNYCYLTSCSGKHLNPNSVEFVKTVHGCTSDEEALEIIHSRNASPFYECNHSDATEYKKAQSRDKAWFDERGLSQEESVSKNKHANSLQGYIDRYGDEGAAKWESVNQLKSITYENLLRKHQDPEVAKKKLEEHRRSTSISLDQHIRRYGYADGHVRYFSYLCKIGNYGQSKLETKDDFIACAASYIKRSAFYFAEDFPYQKKFENSALIRNGLAFFNMTHEELWGEVSSINGPSPLASGRAPRRGFGAIRFTPEGHMLASNLEASFFTKMCENGLNTVPFEVGKPYPNSNLRYDFYFPSVGAYVEIAGLMEIEEYRTKMDFKIAKFGCYVAQTDEEQDQIIRTLVDLHGLGKSGNE